MPRVHHSFLHLLKEREGKIIMKNYTLSLSAYSDIKKMSYEELAKWTADLFAKGVKTGKDSVTSSSAFVAALRDVLKETYDIGDARAEAVIEQLAKVFAEEIAKKVSEGGGE